MLNSFIKLGVQGVVNVFSFFFFWKSTRMFINNNNIITINKKML